MADPASYLTSLFGLAGKTAVIIGGTGTLGSELGRALASAGAHIVICGRGEATGETVVAGIREMGGSAELRLVDATSREELEQLRDTLAADEMPVDVLINAAGINSATPFVEIETGEWDKILDVNLKSVFLACQVFAPGMIEAGRGSIINIASMSAITPLSRVFTYSVSKAGVLNLTRNLAREWAPHNVRVNAISPGFFPAEQNKAVLDEDRVQTILAHTPMARFGEANELAGAVLLLAAPVAGQFITGENLVVDGGFSSMTI